MSVYSMWLRARLLERCRAVNTARSARVDDRPRLGAAAPAVSKPSPTSPSASTAARPRPSSAELEDALYAKLFGPSVASTPAPSSRPQRVARRPSSVDLDSEDALYAKLFGEEV